MAGRGRVRMTYPMFYRSQIMIDGVLIQLTKHQALIALYLSMRGPEWTDVHDLIEMVYEHPDDEPEWPETTIAMQIGNLRKRGVPVMNDYRRRWRLPFYPEDQGKVYGDGNGLRV